MKEKKPYASFWARLGAYLIDFIGMFMFAFLIGITFGSVGLASMIEAVPDVVLGYVIMSAYCTLFLMFFSTTPGKKIYGLIVLNEKNEKITFKQALLRSLLEPLSTFFFGIGYWKLSSDPHKQAWHDKVAHTTVCVKKKVNYIVPVMLSVMGVVIYFFIRNL